MDNEPILEEEYGTVTLTSGSGEFEPSTKENIEIDWAELYDKQIDEKLDKEVERLETIKARILEILSTEERRNGKSR